MAGKVGNLGESLLSTLAEGKETVEQKKMSSELLQELQLFETELQSRISDLPSCSNTTSWALDILREDLEDANVDAKEILKEGFSRSILDSKEIQAKLQALRECVGASFQQIMNVASDDVQGPKVFHSSILKMNRDSLKVRSSELHKILASLLIAIQYNEEMDVGRFTSMIPSTEAQTIETKRFPSNTQDLSKPVDLSKQKSPNDKEATEALSKQKSSNDMELLPSDTPRERNISDSKHNSDTLKWYQDPITKKTMCDPVKATDGYTYDRWTILRNKSRTTCSPSTSANNTTCLVVMDDASTRTRFFLKFPDQITNCEAERAKYKAAALQACKDGNLEDALKMLDNVLQWDPKDEECCNKKADIQCQQGKNKEGGLQKSTVDTASSTGIAHIEGTPMQHLYAPEIASHENVSSTSNVEEREHPVEIEEREHPVEEREHPVEIEGPIRLDITSVTSRELVTMSFDGLQATFNNAERNSRSNIRILANAPCSNYNNSSFFYFEMNVDYVGRSKATPDVAIGFTVIKVQDTNNSIKQLGRYAGSCGYHPLQGTIFYHDSLEEKSIPVDNPPSFHKKGGYVVGAGFHKGRSTAFFMLDGIVVASLAAVHFDCFPPFESLFPAVSLHSRRARVTANFASPWLSREPWPTCFDVEWFCKTQFHVENSVAAERQRLYIFYRIPKPAQGKFFGMVADQPVPLRTDFYHSCHNWYDRMPGRYYNSYGISYFGSHAKLIQNNPLMKHDDINISTNSAPEEDRRIGAGIHYGTNEIFFTENGCFLGALCNHITGQLKPVFAIQNPTITFDTFWGTNYLNWVRRPSHLVPSDCSPYMANPMPTLDRGGLMACHTGSLVFYISNHNEPYSGVAAFRADVVAPLRSDASVTPRNPYYFELTVTKNGEKGSIAIGFCHHSHFKGSIQLGCYPQSCAYHGNSGQLFKGASTGQDFGQRFTEGDRVGAGIDNLTNTIFFVKNGELLGRTSNEIQSCALYPAIGLGSCGEEVHLNFLTDYPLPR